MAENKIELLIKARDEASASLKKLNGEIQKIEGTTAGAARNLDRVGASSKGAAARILEFAAGIGVASVAGAALNKILNYMSSAIDLGGKLSDMSKKFGIAGSELSQFGYIAKMNGVELEGFGRGLQFLSKSMSDASNPASEAARAFNAIGIGLSDIQGKKPTEMFELIADRLHKFEDGANKVAVAQQLLGRSGSDLLPMMEGGAAGLQKMREEAEKAGTVLRDDQIKVLDDAGDALDRWGMKMKVWGAEVVVWTANLLKAASAHNKLRDAILKAAKENPGAVQGMRMNLNIPESHMEEDVFAGGEYVPKGKLGSIAGTKDASKASKAVSDAYLSALQRQAAYYETYNREIADLTLKAAEAREKTEADFWAQQKADAEAFSKVWGALAEERVQADYDAAQESSKATKSLFDNMVTMMDDFSAAAALGLGDLRENIVDLAMTGEVRWHNMTEAILRDIARITVQWSLIQPLTSWNNASFGTQIPLSGLFGGGVVPNAKGAVYDSPQFFKFSRGIGVMAEEGPEGILPLARTASGDLGVKIAGGSGAAAPQKVSVEIINETGQPQKIRRSEARFDGQEFVVTAWLDAYSRDAFGLRSAVGG
jgi:hypothetical protein